MIVSLLSANKSAASYPMIILCVIFVNVYVNLYVSKKNLSSEMHVPSRLFVERKQSLSAGLHNKLNYTAFSTRCAFLPELNQLEELVRQST